MKMASDYVKREVSGYRARQHRKMLYYLAVAAVLFIICVLSLSISRLDISFGQVIEAIWNHIAGTVPDKDSAYLDWWIDRNVVDNGARTVCGICVGAVLAMSGAVMQTTTRNPLTDPYTIGISSAALFGVTLSVIFGFCIIPGVGDEPSKMINAFVFALVPAAVIIIVSSMKRLTSNMMILVGIAMMYLFSAFTTFFKFNADSEKLEEIYRWSLGTLTDTTWDSVAVMVPAAILFLIVLMALVNRIDVLGTGDSASVSLGVNPVILRTGLFVIISAVTAIAVCYTGTIGFVGLVAPHIARLFVGSSNKLLLPLSAMIGAIMIVGADIIVRSIPQDLPIGVITALIGSPLFLYFLYKQRANSAF